MKKGDWWGGGGKWAKKWLNCNNMLGRKGSGETEKDKTFCNEKKSTSGKNQRCFLNFYIYKAIWPFVKSTFYTGFHICNSERELIGPQINWFCVCKALGIASQLQSLESIPLRGFLRSSSESRLLRRNAACTSMAHKSAHQGLISATNSWLDFFLCVIFTVISIISLPHIHNKTYFYINI